MANYPHLESLSADLTALIDRAGAWIVAVQGGRGPGSSGVLWDQEHVLTAEVCDEGAEVGLPDGRCMTAAVLGRMSGWDLALLKLPEPLEIGPPPWHAEPAPGLIVSLGRQMRGGLISSLGMLSSVRHGLHHRSAFGPDFAGGPILDCQGRFLGLNVHGRPPEGVPYARLESAVEEMRQGVSLEPGYLGLGLLALEQGGCLVVKVESGSPSEKARVMLGDQITHLDEVPVNSPEEAQRELRAHSAESAIRVTLNRQGERMELEIPLSARPQRGFPGPGRPFFRAIRKLIHHHGGPGHHHGRPDPRFGPPEPDFGPPHDHHGPPHHGRGRRGGPGGPPPFPGPPFPGPPFDDLGPEIC